MQSSMSCVVLMTVAAFVFFILLNLVPVVTDQIFHLCIENGNYTSNMDRVNLDGILSALPTNIDSSGFYNASSGQAPDRANVIALCRGDVELNRCRRCVQTAVVNLPNQCPYQKQAIIWYPECMLRYSNETIFGILATSPRYWAWSVEYASSPDQFEQDLRRLLNDIQSQAFNGSSPRKFASGNITGPDSQTIYALVQCTPDLHPEDCKSCLTGAAEQIPKCCHRKRGGRILRPSCNLRFEPYPFFSESRHGEPAPPTSGDPVVLPPKGQRKKTRVIIIVVAISSSMFIAVLVGALLRMRAKQEPTQQLETADKGSTVESLQYAFSTIRAATNNFSNDKKLGQGGFGAVYKGILPSGQTIAIKRLSKDSTQGLLEFKNEVVVLARLQHRNLVKLFGFVIEGTEKLLVYEYVRNGSLDNFIFDQVKDSCLSWDTRYKIIGGIARGLLYLHENARLKIIHRDIKPGNILLDEKMNPKIADFGMVKLFEQDETEGRTSRIVGTYGYMPPEYVRNGHVSVKSDVFSFGVLLFEIISGEKNDNYIRGEEYAAGLLGFVWKNWCDGTSVSIADPFLRSDATSTSDILRCIHIGLLCCQETASRRPTMASVVLMLGCESIRLPVPSEPAFYFHSSRSRAPSQSGDECISKNDASFTELHPR